MGELMIALRGTARSVDLIEPLRQRLWTVVGPDSARPDRGAVAYLAGDGEDPPRGHQLYLARGADGSPHGASSINLPPDLEHVSPGDVLDISSDGRKLAVIWRKRSPQNFVLLTERCDNYCLMCSQPPKDVEDSWLLQRALQLVDLLPQDASGFTITGGEPTLYGADFVDLLRQIHLSLPSTEVHILSNGRRFADPAFAIDYATVGNPRVMVGIPLYGAEPSLHDYVVQAEGAFDETIRGILNLVRLGQRVEIRVVVHKLTAPHLVEIAEFISRNLPFVDQVALMGLEMMGLARGNVEEVWIDPFDYRAALTEAAQILDGSCIRTLIYNHQLCLLEPEARQFAVKSISDWKNEYAEVCGGCSAREECGGFFSSAKYRSSVHIHPIEWDADLAHAAPVSGHEGVNTTGLRGVPVHVRPSR